MVVLSELSQGSLSSSSTHGHRYDVFISFRGLDTRNSFTAYLYKALMDANITTFLDDEEIETGEDLKPELESAIKASRASVIVLSKNYATSTWCLDELVLILEQRMSSNHIIIPIFYHVEPTNVRNQQGSFKDAMAKHRRTMEAETNANKRSKWAQKIDSWNKALIEVADLKGKDVNGRQEPEFVEEIVKDIYNRLHISSRSPLPQLIGMAYSIEFATSWLNDASSHRIDVLTILGMGGIGKTSLAKYVYGLHSHEFDTSSFIEDISRKCNEKFNGLLDVQKKLFDDISKPSPIQVHDVSVYTSKIENAVARKKVFLVLDDIDSVDQLDALLGSKCFHSGSKIIITTKDAWLTESCELFKMNGKPRHTKHLLKGLSATQSQELLCFHAFMCNNPKAGYEEVSEKLVEYCEGHPMALKVLGKSLYNRDVAYWEGYIVRLKKGNGSPIYNVLRMSFDSLGSKDDKDLFKHIACFFVGMDRDVALTILEACDIDTRIGITNLMDRHLLDIGWNNKLVMHQLVQEMGRFIVREESPDKPWKRSRLWCHEEIFKVLKQKKGMENLLGIALDMWRLDKMKLHTSFELKTDAFSNMYNLMLLQLNYVQISGSYKNFPEELRWLCLHGFPLKLIPIDLPMENLVALDMSYSSIESFGIGHSNPQRFESRQNLIGSFSKDKRLLRSLKILNLSFCEQLRSMYGFDELPVLERLILTNCSSLHEISESIEQCFELVLVDLSYCINLTELSRTLGMLGKVKTLLLNGLYLGESRIKIRDKDLSENLNDNNIGINTIASSSAVLEAIPSDSKFFAISLPRSLVSLSLENNSLCTDSFPIDFSCLFMLKELYLDNNPIVSLPSGVRTLPRLEMLSVHGCKLLMSFEHPPHTLRKVILHNEYVSDYKPMIRKVVFDPEMYPLDFVTSCRMLAASSFEFQGVLEIQPMEGVEEKVLRSLGWIELDFTNSRRMAANLFSFYGSEDFDIQMYYQFGIFSTIYWGKEMPNWITDRSTGPSILFTVPSSPKQLTGLNLCYVLMPGGWVPRCCESLKLPLIIISNITKKHTWIYEHIIHEVLDVGEKCVTLLSHWMFGMNEMECGDEVNITVWRNSFYGSGNLVAKECGVSFVYDDGEEDVLGHYKSWNHIIGKDLTRFQLTTGEYFLNVERFIQPLGIRVFSACPQLYLYGSHTMYKEENVWFRALSSVIPKKV